MRAWITKYALSEGIIEVDDAVVNKEYPSTITVPSLGFLATFHGDGLEWHRTRDDAVSRANAMLAAKIASHSKAIKRLESIKFS